MLHREGEVLLDLGIAQERAKAVIDSMIEEFFEPLHPEDSPMPCDPAIHDTARAFPRMRTLAYLVSALLADMSKAITALENEIYARPGRPYPSPDTLPPTGVKYQVGEYLTAQTGQERR